MRSAVKTVILFAIVLVLASFITFSFLFYYGVLHFNNPSSEEYPVRGVDVSSYQGLIKWDEFAKNDLQFAYIKATEGVAFVDKSFEYNWMKSNKTQLYVGAYHVFSFESNGKAQAENYISTVGELNSYNLPPVIDIEYREVKPEVSAQIIREEIVEMVEALKEEYGKQPILYVTKDTYYDIVFGYLDDIPLWIRSVFCPPNYMSNWVLWQYSNRHVLSGYNGGERYVDMNVYNGDLTAFLFNFGVGEE